MSRDFWFNGKGNVTLSIGILCAIIASTWVVSAQVHQLRAQVIHNTRNRWSSVHMKVWCSRADQDPTLIDETLQIVNGEF